MAPEWWFRAMEAAIESHDPDEHEGREWDELTEAEQNEAIEDQIY